MVFSVLPTFMSDKLGVSYTGIGWIEGVAVAASFVTKVLSGVGSDIIKKRVPFILWGSVFTVLSKPMFAFSAGVGGIFLARFIDRLSKGVRSAPTDAFIADVSTQSYYGRAYGLRQCLYTGGAVLGALLSMLLIFLTDGDYRLIFLLSIFPGSVAVVLAFRLFEKKPKDSFSDKNFILRIDHIKLLPKSYWLFIVFVSILMLARFSEAFLILKAKEVGFSITMLPLVIIIMDVVHALVTIPSGKLADRFSAKWVLFWGVAVFGLTHFYIYKVSGVTDMYVGLVLVGIHMGMTQGALKSVVADKTPKAIRGTAFAIFYLISGFFVLVGNATAGMLSDYLGLSYTFLGGYGFTLIAFVFLFFYNQWEKTTPTNSSGAYF